MYFKMTKKELVNLIEKQLKNFKDDDVIEFDEDYNDFGAWTIISVNEKIVYESGD